MKISTVIIDPKGGLHYHYGWSCPMIGTDSYVEIPYSELNKGKNLPMHVRRYHLCPLCQNNKLREARRTRIMARIPEGVIDKAMERLTAGGSRRDQETRLVALLWLVDHVEVLESYGAKVNWGKRHQEDR